ncbi:uncharacterized protein [Drosophila takahashii]|uniref:uncharacterized protein n=1 Tax=Drosophila takahashii TaxID=29030 RepID=UPI00389943CB
MQSNRVHYLRKGYSWPKLGNHSRIGCFLKKAAQAKGMENQTKTETKGKPAIKVKPEVPPKPKRKAKLAIAENRDNLPPEIKVTDNPMDWKPEVFPKVEVKIVPGAKFESLPLGNPQNNPEVKSQSKTEVIEVFRQTEEMFFPKPGSATGAIPKIMLKCKATLRVKRKVKDNAIPKAQIAEVKRQTGDVNNLKQKLLFEPKVIIELKRPSQKFVIPKAENKPKSADMSVILSQTDKADIPMPENKPKAELNEEMIFKTQVITLNKPEVMLQPKEVVISKPVSKFTLKPEPNQETGIPKSENRPKSEGEFNEEIIFKPQVIPDVIMESEKVIMSKPVSKFTLQAEKTPENNISKPEKSPESETEFNERIIFKPQVFPEVIMHSEEVVISNSVCKSNQEAKPSQETDTPKLEKIKFNQELLLKPHFRPYAIFLRKSELIVHSPPKQEAEPNPEMVHMLQTKGKSGDVLEPQVKIKPEVNRLGAGDEGKSTDQLLDSVKDWLDECKDRKPVVLEDFDFFADGDREKTIEEMQEDLRKYKAISARNHQRTRDLIDREFGEIRHNLALMNQAQDKMIQQYDQWWDLHTRQVLSRK